MESNGGATSFRWKAHPVVLRSTVVASEQPRSFAFLADSRGLHAEHSFTVRPTPDGKGTVVVSDEFQVGPLPRLGRVYLGPRLFRANQAWLSDLARAASSSR